MLLTDLPKRLQEQKRQGRLRHLHTVDRDQNNDVIIDKQYRCLDFASNDYLSLSNDPRIKESFAEAASRYGLGSGASLQVSGYSRHHQALEEAFAEFLNRERALLFNTGYQANLGMISALANRHSTIIADKHCHASLIDGIQLSRAKHVRYRHQQLNHAHDLLLQCKNQQRLLVSESVFSIDGSITRVDTLASLAKQTDTLLMIDEAHGIGWLGANGRGSSEFFNLKADTVHCLSVPLGKAVGSMGGIVAGDQNLIDTLTQFARTHRYTTALPPALVAATLKSLSLLISESWRRQQLQALIQFFIAAARERQLPLLSEDVSPIKSIMIGDEENTLRLKNLLMQQGYWVAAIRPPTVASNNCCLRISLHCDHRESDILRLLDVLVTHHARP